ncbi:MAG: hypothetical protein MUF42_15580 [Cytophagaceae bacterium]|jgi:hypothetical protein|nr:hypothetical protein [Cytophagaceae bacterium]
MERKFNELKKIVATTHDIEVYKLYLEKEKNTWFKVIIASPITPVFITAILGIFTAYKAVKNEEVKQKKEIMFNAIVQGDSIQTSQNLKFLYNQGLLESDVSQNSDVYKVELSKTDTVSKVLEGTWKLAALLDAKGNRMVNPLVDTLTITFLYEYALGGKVLVHNNPNFPNAETVLKYKESLLACNQFDYVEGYLNVNGFRPKVLVLNASELVLDGMIPCLYGFKPDIMDKNEGLKVVFTKVNSCSVSP